MQAKAMLVLKTLLAYRQMAYSLSARSCWWNSSVLLENSINMLVHQYQHKPAWTSMESMLFMLDFSWQPSIAFLLERTIKLLRSRHDTVQLSLEKHFSLSSSYQIFKFEHESSLKHVFNLDLVGNAHKLCYMDP